MNDVWISSDGEHWSNITHNAKFSPRENHAAVVFKDRIFVIGGYNEKRLNDVWASNDGNKWTLLTKHAEFSPRNVHTACVFLNKIWVIGGYDGSNFLGDMWSSYDGVIWAKEIEAEFKISSHTCVIVK